MQQLYASGPVVDPSARGPGAAGAGHQPALRAASPGLRAEDVQAALPYTNYAPPPDRGAGARPVRLSLFQVPAVGRVLVHVAPTGGEYFAHALLNVPATADAQLAIRTWGSPAWQRRAPDGAGNPPEMPYLPVADALDDTALRGWLAEPAHRAAVEFVLAALLATPAETRVVVAAPAEDVARIVYAATRALPHGLLEGFTFSTYEPAPLAAPVRLVGCDTGGLERDLPDACYTGGAVAINVATGRRSELPAAVPFAVFAADALAAGRTAPLDELQTTWQMLGLTDGRQFDLVHRLAVGSAAFTKEEAVAAVGHPALAAWIAARPAAVSRLVGWALDDADFARQVLGRLAAPLRQRTDALARVADEVRDAGLAAVAAGDSVRAATALDVILPTVAPARAGAAWGELLARFADPTALAWDVRRYLLPRLVRFKHPGGPAAAVDPALADWLDVTADRLGELLALDLPKPYHLAAARACLARDGEPTPTLARAAATRPGVVLDLLQGEGAAAEGRAAALFALLLAEAPERPWLEDVLAAAETFPAPARDRFLEVALSAGAADPARLIRAHGPTLLAQFSCGSGLERLGALLLANPPADLLTDTAALEFLTRLSEGSQVGDDVKGRVAAVRAVRRFLDAPDLSAEALSPVAAALTAQPPVLPAGTGVLVLDAVSAELARRSAADGFQGDLEQVLLHLGTTLAATPAGLYRELLRRHRARRDFGTAPAARGFLAVALGAAENPTVREQCEGLEAEAFAVATDAARRGGRRALRGLDGHARGWPAPARAQWGFLVEAVRPKEVGRSVRELSLFAAGAGAASAVWFLVAQFLR